MARVPSSSKVPAETPAQPDMAAMIAAAVAQAMAQQTPKAQQQAPKAQQQAPTERPGVDALLTGAKLVGWKATAKGKPYAVVELKSGQRLAIWP